MIVKLPQKIRLLLLGQKKDRDGRFANRRKRLPSWVLQGILSCKEAPLPISLLITGLLLGVKLSASLQPLELAAFDQMVRLQKDAPPDPRILVVAIAESDIQSIKEWPLSDRVVAQLIQKLQQYDPKVIGLDLHRDLPQGEGQAALLEQLQAPNVIAINALGDEKGGVPPPPTVPTERIGFTDFVIDPDGVLRRNLMFAALGNERFYSFSLRVSLSYLSDRDMALNVRSNGLCLGNARFAALQARSGGYQNIDDQGYQVLLNYHSPERVAQQVTLTQVLQGQINPDWVKDKIVLIGTTAPSAKDSFLTPYSASQQGQPLMPGVIVHAQMISQILSAALDEQKLFWFWNEGTEALWLWTWSFAGGILAWRLRHPLVSGLVGVVMLGGLFGVSFLIFTQAGWVPVVLPALAFIVTGSATLAYKVLHSVSHDPLTALPNRVLFVRHLQKAIARTKHRQSDLLAILFLGLDRFKVINESFGHQIGDQLLIATISRLKTCLRAGDQVARVGGDEFAILLEQLDDVSEATSVADSLHKALQLPFHLNGQEIFTTVSTGIAFNQTGYEHHPEDLLRDAHTAMYRAKSLGKARHEIFATGMRTAVVKRLQLETDLRQALERKEFLLHYQPIISTATSKIAGFEALVRWLHPQHGYICPLDFISVAEETGLIDPLGLWILQTACRQMHLWHELFPSTPPLMISVNLSSGQLTNPDLVEQIEQVLETTQLNSHSLKLEITESMMMDEVESTITQLVRLKALGIQLGIDDFGTGYSSLSYLHRFPIDMLKVDRSFVSRMEDTSENGEIVRTIIKLGHNLGMNVIAEGVETSTQMQVIRDLQCEYGQGYFFSKPLPADAATVLLSQAPQW
ncbi:MAG: EAL domain-containing protein [Kastovskya adunca ATA6-11-RM4]|nr:EAL domain-containing protein [Kastovskya adunca ATA6-11-RM4]